MSSLRKEVDVTLLREAFLRSGVSAHAVARELGWTRPDGARVRRALGISVQHSRGCRFYQRSMSYDRAVRIAEAIGVDPAEVDL